MTGSYDGSIRIDTSINSQPIDNGISAIENKIKSIGTTIGLAFGVKELVDFGKRAVTAASDLAEAQNVVDTAFGDMSWKMEQFAATALDTYGISELTAKNMGSTYMAMAKGMGVATDAASDMAVTLTGRLSDIMSFYNKTQSEVDTIGRALITGETEPLKAIGVVMTQTNLSAYAMAQGFAKTYEEMSSNEQLLVRYKYFLEQTAMAQGDFAKTSEGWANQTRLLSERWNEFITNFGGLIMNTLTPALEFANEAVSFLNELFFGGKDNAENTFAVKNAEAVTDEVTSMGAAADKSKKKLNNLIAGFDELHIISGAGSDKEKEQTTYAGIDTSNLLGVNLDADTKTAKKAAGKYRDVINEIYLAFKRHPLTKTVEGIIKGVGKFFGFIKDNNKISAGNIVDTLMDILGAILAYKAVKGIVGGVSTFAKGFGGLIGIITAHPVAAAVVGITGLAIGIFKLADELKRQEIASHFGDISISLEEIDELVSPIDKDINNLAKAFSDNESKIKTSRDNFVDLSKAIGATTDALKFSSSSEDIDKFTQQVDEYIDAALDYTNAKNDTSALRELYMADDKIDDTEQAVLDSIENLNGSVSSKIETIRAQIHAITQAAADENRGLVEAEIENIKKLYDELARLTSTQGDIEQSATWERLVSRAYTYDSYDVLLEEIKKAREQSEASQKEIDEALFKQMTSTIMDMRADGASESEIEKFRQDFIKSTDDSLNQKKKKSAEYELKLLDAWGKAHYEFTEDKLFDDFTKNNYNFQSDESRKRLKDYYEMYKKALQSGDQRQENLEKISQLANDLNEQYYLETTTALYRALVAEDKTYGDWSNERNAVVQSLTELGDEGASGFTNCFVDVIKGAETFDGAMLVPDINDFYKFGGDSGQAYLDGLADYIHEAAQSKNLNVEQVLGYTEKTFPGAQTYNLSPYVSPQYYPTNTQDPKVTLSLYLNDEFKDTYTMGGAAGTAAAVSVPLRDINVDNGKSWGR